MTMDVARSLVRAAERFEWGARQVQNGLDTEIPRWFGTKAAMERRDSAYVRGMEQARLGLAELEGIAEVNDITRKGVTQLSDVVDAARPFQQRYRPSYIGVHLVPRHLQQYAQSLRLQAALTAEGTDPAVIRTRLREQVEQVTLRPFDDITDDEIVRIGQIAMLPDHLRPDLPGSLNSRGYRGRLALDDPQWMRNGMHVSAELDHIRVQRAARELAADTTVTRDALDGEVRALLAKPDADITIADSERLSVISRLPDDRRPALVDRPKSREYVPIQHFSSWGYVPAKEPMMRNVLDSLRRAVVEDELLADRTFTKERATAELLSFMARPATQLTPPELVRVSTLAGLPEHLRPSLPTLMEEWAVLGDPGTVLRPNGHKPLRTFTAVRDHLTEQDPLAMARELVRQDRTGSSIDLELVALLAKRPGLLDRVGIDAEFLHRQSIQALATAGGDRSTDLASSLRIARGVVERHPASADQAISKLRTEALELADRNLARMDGTRTDTYGRHPDYAEVGRFASNATLLHQMRQVTAAKAAQAPAAAAATEQGTASTATGERLTW